MISAPKKPVAYPDNSAARRRILCVDDEPLILEALALTLGRYYQIEMAPSGKAALEILRAKPDTAVIISDMRMPSMNGAQFLADSRKIAPTARRILLTGHADAESTIVAVNEGGLFRFLTKPCSSAILIEAVKAAIADSDEDANERSAIRRAVTQDLLSHDALTGLASRGSLLERLSLCRGTEEAGDWRPEVIFVIEMPDFDELSSVHDSKTVDQLLRIWSEKLRAAIPGATCLARYREATFVALVSPEESSDRALYSLASTIVGVIEEPVDLDGVSMQSRTTVGIARIPVGVADPRSALRYAELAAQEAKRYGVDRFRIVSLDSIIKSERRRETIQALRGAVARQQLSLCYQPIIDIEQNRVYSVEALARWEHPQLGIVSPTLFIPLAEETGLMIPLGEWVLNRACVEGRNLCKSGFDRVSVNLSVTQLLDSRFMYVLCQAIERSGIDPACLELELTETVFAGDLDRVCTLLSKIRLLGVSIAIDDFGAGYSSLAYLARLPVDVLKIDRTFVHDLDRGGGTIIEAALAAAHALKIEVIVEGIETELQLERVRTLGATKVQGFVFAQPMPAPSLSSWHELYANRRAGVDLDV